MEERVKQMQETSFSIMIVKYRVSFYISMQVIAMVSIDLQVDGSCTKCSYLYIYASHTHYFYMNIYGSQNFPIHILTVVIHTVPICRFIELYPVFLPVYLW